jgi:hypothetical protein
VWQQTFKNMMMYSRHQHTTDSADVINPPSNAQEFTLLQRLIAKENRVFIASGFIRQD